MLKLVIMKLFLLLGLLVCFLVLLGYVVNFIIYNLIFLGFYLDLSCIFVFEWDDIFFCVLLSFNVFLGIFIYVSKDL